MATDEPVDELTTSQSEPSGRSTLSPSHDLPCPEVCVICLDRISEKAVALPCGHDQFDFPCLGTWLQQQRICPLCKGAVRAIRYDAGDGGSKVFHLPVDEFPQSSVKDVGQGRSQHSVATRIRRDRRPRQVDTAVKETGLESRRNVYRSQLYSLRVGSNRVSGHRNITPSSFAREVHLTTRARMWIRRELSVFEFLNPNSASFGATDRRATNAEFLLEYIIAILKSIDLRGSTGQAEELLKDFLGRDNARLFLHELEAWLRSPHESLEDWDRAVQYADSNNLVGRHSRELD